MSRFKNHREPAWNAGETLPQDLQVLADKIISDGWDPLDPSRDCERELARPPGFGHLHWIDSACVQWYRITLKLLKRYDRGAKSSWKYEPFLVTTACVYLMTQIRCRVEWTLEEYLELRRMVETWWDGRYSDTARRLNDAIRKGMLIDEAFVRRDEFEPAITLMQQQARIDLGSVDADRRRMAIAVHMHEEGVKSGLRSQVREVSMESLMGYFDLISKDGRKLSYFDGRGHLVLSPLHVKSAFDRKLGRAKRRRFQPMTDLGAEIDLEPRVNEEEEQASVNTDLLPALEAVIAARLAKSPAGSVRRLVIENFVRIVQDNTTPVRLAAQHKVSDRAIRKEFARERDAIKQAMGA